MNRRKCITLTGATLGVSITGCLGDSGSTDETNTDAKSAALVVEKYLRAAANDPDPDLVDQFFHSKSPNADFWRDALANTDPDNWADIIELDVRVINENPTEEEIYDWFEFISDEQMREEIIDIAVTAPESAIVRVETEAETQGLKSPRHRPVATEDGDWKIVW